MNVAFQLFQTCLLFQPCFGRDVELPWCCCSGFPVLLVPSGKLIFFSPPQSSHIKAGAQGYVRKGQMCSRSSVEIKPF
jgi:hypothetical protein